MLGTRANAVEAELTGLRRRFWGRYVARHRGVFKPTRDANIWIPMLRDRSVILSIYVARKASGMSLRGPKGGGGEELESILSQYAEKLDRAFGPSHSAKESYFYETWIDIGIWEEESWDEIIDWMDDQRQRYAEILRKMRLEGSERLVELRVTSRIVALLIQLECFFTAVEGDAHLV